MLGCFQQIYPSMDGIPQKGSPRSNSTHSNTPSLQLIQQQSGAARVLKNDPKHEYPNVMAQLANANAGFLDDYARSYPQSDQDERAEIMKYHDLDVLPALHALGRNFTICDHWFASVPGPTWTNRLFAQSGTSRGIVTMPSGILNLNWHWYDQPTIYDRLNEKNISWKVYFGDVPNSLLLVHQLEPKNASRYRRMMEFYEDAAGNEGDFPAFSFIEPEYFQPGATDDHPVHDIMGGERLIADVYNAIRKNQPLWESTLLVVLFDEHGGFYDHVSPPAAVPPDHFQDEYTFDRLGVRVPAILVSPWVGKGVLNTQFDHTSLLKYLTDKWELGALGDRVANVATFANAISEATPRTDTPVVIPSAPAGRATTVTPPELNGNQQALLALTQAIEARTNVDPAVVAARSQAVLSGAGSQTDVAIDRIQRFLDQQRTTAFADLA